jgi:hypothetical protein
MVTLEALARLLPWRTFSRYTTRFVEMPKNPVLSRHSNPARNIGKHPVISIHVS